MRILCADLGIKKSFAETLARSESFEDFIETLVQVCKTFEDEIQDKHKALKADGM